MLHKATVVVVLGTGKGSSTALPSFESLVQKLIEISEKIYRGATFSPLPQATI